MSLEKIIPAEEKKFETLTTPEVNKEKTNSRVDINHLLAKVREEKRKENTTNMIIFISIASFVFIVGIILSF
tara:strand:+ start:601 stop:816 length:216 start_codon:yes stop_codon:yes gene_type:complete